jgi:hypothetical protein
LVFGYSKNTTKEREKVALTNYEEIKNRITAELPALLSNPYAEDTIAELADAEVPVYDNEIIQDWVLLSSDDSDQWKELGYDTQKNEGGIVRLMAIDLAIYYVRQFDRAWTEIKAENEN